MSGNAIRHHPKSEWHGENSFHGFPQREHAWQSARSAAANAYAKKFGRPAPWGLENVRVHDLKHTFGRRLRAAGVAEETRKVLLGHKNGDITTHYSVAELAELLQAVNKIDRGLATPAITLLRAAA